MPEVRTATIVTLDIRPDREDEFRKIMSAMIADVKANETGTLFYALARESDESKYRVIEIYTSAEAASEHSRRDSVRHNARAIGSCLAAPVTIEKLQIIE